MNLPKADIDISVPKLEKPEEQDTTETEEVQKEEETKNEEVVQKNTASVQTGYDSSMNLYSMTTYLQVLVLC